MSDFNYADFLKSGPQKQYNSYMNDSYIELSGMDICVFKLDKVLTKKSELYGSEDKTRIYLPHFKIRSLYNNNKWSGALTLNIYEETEDDCVFTVNFDRMVNTHRELKNKKSGEIKLSYISNNGTPYLQIKNNIFTIYIDSNIYFEKSFEDADFNTVKKVVNKLNTVSLISCTFDGENEQSVNIENIDKTSFKNIIKGISVRDNTYINISDVIEMGDMILTDKFRLYEITQAAPAGNIGWNYSTYLLKGTIVDLSLADSLPNDYREIINNNQYGISKIDKE